MKLVKWIADRKDVLTQAVCLLFSLGCVFLFFRFFSLIWNLLLYMLASGASFLSLRASLRCRDKRSWAVLSVFGALFSAAVVVGRRVDE